MELGSPERHARRVILRFVLPGLAGVFCALVGIAALPAVLGDVGPTRVALRLFPGAGETRLHLTPLGTISADTHVVPTRLELSLEEANVERLARAATSPTGREELRSEVSKDLRSLALRAAMQVTAMVCLLAAAAAALLLGRHLSVILTAMGCCVLTAGGMGIALAASFDSRAFEQPTFSGSISKAHQVIEVVARGEEVLDRARSRFDIASGRLSELFVLLTDPADDPREAETVVLHVSDIHANPIAFGITKRLATEFDADAILDTGDLGSAELDTGNISSAIDPIDSALATEIGRLGVPYVYVPGNHDSPQLRRRVAAIPNVTLLDGSVVTVDSLGIMGFADPTFSTTPVPESLKSERRAEVAETLGDTVLAQSPDVVAVHDSVLASGSVGVVPLILAGHTHERSTTEADGTLTLTVGSTGATGLKHLTVESGRRYEAQILYFEGVRLSAVDYVSLADLGGDFELSRQVYQSEESALGN